VFYARFLYQEERPFRNSSFPTGHFDRIYRLIIFDFPSQLFDIL